MKKILKNFLKPFRHLLENVFEFEARVAKTWASSSHKRLFFTQWNLGEPEWFDHSIDLYYQWPKYGVAFWVERGVYGSLALKGGKVLDLCCGDGFNAKYFYSHLSSKVVSCDFDKSALKTAISKNQADNIDFIEADIRTSMPKGEFQNIIWDAAIEHFTEQEIDKIICQIKARLTSDGIVSGYTIVERDDGQKSLHQHEYEFKSKEDLERFFAGHFKNITVFETIYKNRHNLYFWASNGEIPFSKNWRGMVTNCLE